jgi:L-alanine-DL-glutamate epimerase-like enolase superfamily enzyme
MTEPDIRDPIAEVHAVRARFPLARVLRLGALHITHREYTFVTVTTRDGYVGKAFALTRDMPVAEIVRAPFAQLLIGRDADAIAARWDDCHRATISVGRVGLVMRALSLVDIALWDIKAQRAGLPLWRLLGGFRPELPVSLVAGYLSEGATPEAVADMVLTYAAAGYRYLKVARSADPALTDRLLTLVHAALPASSQVVVDGLWVWRTTREAIAEVESWGEHRRLAWIEDPFPAEEVDLCAEFRARCVVPIAVGDEMTDQHAFKALLHANAIDVVRVDATAIGGISAALRVMHLAAAAHRDVAPHVYPEVHVHCAAAMPGCVAVETFDPAGNDFELSHQFVVGGPRLEAGHMYAPEVPGLGFELDWERIKRFTPTD